MLFNSSCETETCSLSSKVPSVLFNCVCTLYYIGIHNQSERSDKVCCDSLGVTIARVSLTGDPVVSKVLVDRIAYHVINNSTMN